MDKQLARDALIKFAAGFVLVGLLVFLPAGTLAFPASWTLMAALFLPMLVAGFVMLFFAPDLLRSRLEAREDESAQRGVLLASGLMFIAAFVLAGLTFRFGWIAFPVWVQRMGLVFFLVGYALFAEVLRENQYLARTVRVQEGQHVVDTGLYGLVRHPMYFATVLLFLSMPVVLGSPLSFVVTLVYLPIIARRIENEEQVLARELRGYEEYRQKVRWRLVPFVW